MRGNADETIASETVDDDFPADSPYRRSAELLHAWTHDRLDAEVLRSLGALPFEYRLSTPAGDLLVVHSSPRGTRGRCGGPHNTFDETTAAYAKPPTRRPTLGGVHHFDCR